MKPKILFIIATFSLTVICLTDASVFSLTPAALLIGLPFTIGGVTSGTLAALGALKLLAATALALSYTGSSFGVAGEGPNGGSYGTGGVSYGGGSHGGGYGDGGHAYPSPASYGGGPSGGQYKRSVDNHIGNMELYFHIINEVDANNCALRLICELEATKDKSKMDEDERMILALFGPKPKDLPVEVLKTPSGPYHFAAYIGSTSTGTECGKFYSKCPYNRTQMMSALRAASGQ